MLNRPYTKRQLDTMAKQRCGELRTAILKRRAHTPRADFARDDIVLDMKKVVAACGLGMPPFMARTGTNEETLHNAHPFLEQLYHNVGLNIGQIPNGPMRIFPGVKNYYPAGHCAEPHAAHRLLNAAGIQQLPVVTDLLFSTAYDIKNNNPHPYCGTCRLAFPQLR